VAAREERIVTGHTERLTTAIKALDLVDELLDTRGMEPDCSARHNLAIARSLVNDVLSDERRLGDEK
jgi:hypothetical protein